MLAMCLGNCSCSISAQHLNCVYTEPLWAILEDITGKKENHQKTTFIISGDYFLNLIKKVETRNHLKNGAKQKSQMSRNQKKEIMKYLTLTKQALSICFAAVLMSGCSSPAEKTAAVVNPNYEIASPEYSELAVKALTSWCKFDFDAWTSTMSDNVVFYFPDGDAGTRTELAGKKAVLDWWNNWKQTSGIQQMTYLNHVDIPVIAKDTLPYSNLTGVFVISYFSNELIYNGTTVKLRMNVTVHFNSNKLIDRVYTYYDRTKIVEIMKRNILDIGN